MPGNYAQNLRRLYLLNSNYADQTNCLYFLNGDVQRAVIDQERKDNFIQTYVKDSSLPYVDVEVKNVILDDLRQSPYSARIEFEKVYTNLQIIPRSSASDGRPASPMSSART